MHNQKTTDMLDGVIGRLENDRDTTANMADNLLPSLKLATDGLITQNMELSRKLAAAEKARAELQRQLTMRQAPNQTAIPASQSRTADAEPPMWRPGARRSVDTEIRRAAVEKWSGKYDMIEYEIRQQTEAYDKLLEYNKDWHREAKRIIASAVDRWGTNWRMVVYEIDKQTEAARRLSGG